MNDVKELSIFESYENALERLKKEYHCIEVFHYYNKHYSQTGGIYKKLEDALNHARQDGLLDKSEFKNVKNEISKDGDYEIFQFYIQKIKIFGDEKSMDFRLNENPSKFKGDVYFLRHPGIAFMSIEKAYEIGLKYVLSEGCITTCNTYIWGRKRDFKNRTRTVCDKDWVIKVLDDYAFTDSKYDTDDENSELFFNYISGNYPEDDKNSKRWNTNYNFVWKELWKARIEEDEFSCKNHIEEVDSCRILL